MAATATRTVVPPNARLATARGRVEPGGSAAPTSLADLETSNATPAAGWASAHAPGAAIRWLAATAAPAAPAARLRLPLAMADVAALLWTTLLKFDAADPGWPDRDRFVLSDPQGKLLPRALLQLTSPSAIAATNTGVADPALDGLRWHCAEPNRAEPDTAPEPPVTDGPDGQGLATAIGMALAERMLAARFGRSLADHRTWVLASACDLASGLGHEAICLAGELHLGRLAVLYDAREAPAANHAKRFHAAGWAVRDADGHDPAAIAGALSFAVRSRKPSLIICRTDDPGSPGSRAAPPAGSEGPQGADGAGVLAAWRAAGQRGAGPRRAWLKRLAQHPLRAEFERTLSGRRPDEWRDALAAVRRQCAGAAFGLGTRHASHRALEALIDTIPELLSCAAGRAEPARADAAGLRMAAGNQPYRGRRLSFGAREHGMAAALNGLALHGGWLPVGRFRAAASDSLRPALRLAATLRQQVIHILTPDSTGDDSAGPDDNGGAGQAHPGEPLASLRALPKTQVFRPADAVETMECLELALRRIDGPSVILLSDHPQAPLPRAGPDNRAARGAYVLVEPAERRAATLIATGTEVAIALQAQARLLASKLAVAVVSMPCWDLFAAQDEAYRALVLGTAPRIGIEAACGFGWERWLGGNGRFIGLPDPGATLVGAGTRRDFGITPDAVIDVVRTLAYRA